MKLSKLKNIIKEEIQKLKNPQLLNKFKFPLQEQEVLLHKFSICAITISDSTYDGDFYVCADEGAVGCTPGNVDFDAIMTGVPNQTFYEAVGSPSPGDLIKFDGLITATSEGPANTCFRYVGLAPMTGQGLAASLYIVNNYTSQNMGSDSCESCLLVNHSCDFCGGCTEDPNGPFSSLEECQASGCNGLQGFALSLGIMDGVSNMTAAEQYCMKCSTNSYSSPMDEKCGCCPQGQPVPTGMAIPDKEPNTIGMVPPIKGKVKDPVKNRMQRLANIKPKRR